MKILLEKWKKTQSRLKSVRLGSTVTIKKIDDHHKSGDEIVYTIVGSVEADPENGRISNECPLAVALLSKKLMML